jgi:hypothetical protein
MSLPTTRLWRIAGALALAHVALMLGGFAFEPGVVLGEGRSADTAGLVHSSLPTALTGGYIEYLGFLAFLLAVPLLGRLLRGTGEVQGWLGSCITSTGVVYAAVTIAAGFPAGAAALYHAHHGTSLATVVAIDDVRNFAYFLSIGVLGVFTVAVAAAVRATGALPRWIAWAAYPTGVLLLASVPAARTGALDYASLLWAVWFVALAVVALRGPRTTLPAAVDAEVARV